MIDAEDVVLGRLAVAAATLLRGKHKATYAPHVDGGDFEVRRLEAFRAGIEGRVRVIFRQQLMLAENLHCASLLNLRDFRLPKLNQRMLQNLVAQLMRRNSAGLQQVQAGKRCCDFAAGSAFRAENRCRVLFGQVRQRFLML